MKIGLVLERFDPQKGGLENWTWQFAHRLLAGGHEVHVLAFEFAESATRAGLHLHRPAMPESRLQRAAVLERELRLLDLDVVHDMGCGWQADLFHPHGGSTKALWEHNLLRIPRWRQIRFWREKRYRETAEIERRQLSCANSLIATVSRMVEDHFHTLHAVPRDRMRLVYNGVDTEHFSPEQCRPLRESARRALGCADGDTLFLLVAHNLLLKNADTTLRALARVVAGGAAARLAIVGGKKPKHFARLAQKLGIAGAVQFVAANADVRPFYAAADAYVHPTWYDPCSLVVLEAMACGLPVVTTRYNGVSEIMTEDLQGFILENPADGEALASKMTALLDPVLRRRMGGAGRELAERHTLSAQTDRFLELYREIAEAKRAGYG